MKPKTQSFAQSHSCMVKKIGINIIADDKKFVAAIWPVARLTACDGPFRVIVISPDMHLDRRRLASRTSHGRNWQTALDNIVLKHGMVTVRNYERASQLNSS